MVSSCAAVMMGRPEPVVSSNRNVKGVRSGRPLRDVEPQDQGIRDAVVLLYATSLSMMMRRGMGCLVRRRRAPR